MLLNLLINIYCLIVVAAVVVSWTDVPRAHPVVELLYRLTEPVLAPIRKVLSPIRGIDFSPLVLLIGLRVLATFF